MAHKFKGVNPGMLKIEERCALCFQQFKKEQKADIENAPGIIKWQGLFYHQSCFDREMKKPLHKRFNKSF